MKIICPIRPQNFEDFLSLRKKIKKRADIIEIWLDQIQDYDHFFTNFAKQKKPEMLYIGVCKRPEEKGVFGKSASQRVAILGQFINHRGNFVDLDVTQNTAWEIKKIPPKKLMLSFHDFEAMPKNLEEIFQNMKSFNPLVYKFAVTTDTEADLEEFIKFAKEFPKNKNAIFATMGNLGHFGRERIKDFTWGQFFALNNKHKTASGQKTLNDISKY